MTIAVISHPDCLRHEHAFEHPERPDRSRVVQEALEQFTFKAPVEFHQADMATRDHLKAAHDEAYVDWIFSVAPKEEVIAIDDDTYMNPYSLTAALRAAGSVIQAVDMVMQDEAKAVFCNVRPPGHHAERDKAMGFCLFNNVAVGVRYAMNEYQLERIAIIDFDVHHGNGTQHIFQHDKRVLLCSSFEHPFYPGYDEEMDDDHILNVPLPAGTHGKVYRESVKNAWFDKIAAFKPQLIFFSAGFDAHEKDPLANLMLGKDDYVWLTQEIARLAKLSCDGKMISVLEGGYDLEALASCVPAHVNAMILGD
jgi:acetoin utilization deacetylase AcuC-like enzyme